MKIEDAYIAGASASELKKAQQAEGPAADAKAGGRSTADGESDGVRLSELSSRLLELASGDSPARAARLERLAAEFRAGRYYVDPLAVSRRLIEDAFERQ